MKLRRLFIFLLIILLLALLSVYWPKLTGKSINNQEYKKEPVFVSQVVDGDTFKDLNGQSYRLLGINTPEKNKPYYKEAKDFIPEENARALLGANETLKSSVRSFSDHRIAGTQCLIDFFLFKQGNYPYTLNHQA